MKDLNDKDVALVVAALRTAAKQHAVSAGAAYRKVKGTADGDTAMNARAECLALAGRLEAK